MDGDEIKKLRVSAGLSQKALAAMVDVSQGAVSIWESGRSKPRRAQVDALKRAFGEREVEVSASPSDAYGEWLRESREAAGLSRDEVAARAGVSKIQIYNIETGRTANPRVATREALEKALQLETPTALVEAVDQSAEIQGVGRMSDFDPHDEDDHPREPGVYVFYDISDRPIYVGESNDIRKRIKGHTDKFWYKAPIVQKASYVRVDDQTLRRQLEETLIKFLKSNAVINKQLVER